MRTLGVSVEKIEKHKSSIRINFILFSIIVGFLVLYIYDVNTQNWFFNNLKVNLILCLTVIKYEIISIRKINFIS